MRQRPLGRAGGFLIVALIAASCSSGGPAATVDGFDIAPERIEQLHPENVDVDDEIQASSLFLIILHHLVTREADAQFDLVTTEAEVDEALAARAGTAGELLDQRLADRGVTRARVLLEAELDVLRTELQREFIDRGGPGVDLDAAYRTFLSVNSRACVELLAPASDAAVAEVQRVTDGVITLDSAREQLGELVETIDLGCDNPVQLPPPVQSVALDGEVGVAYLSTFSDGTLYVAAVTSRDAPGMDEVIEDVKQIAADTQGLTLFNEWAFELLRTADVTVDADLWSWEPREGTAGVPTVVPRSGAPG
ncbi:MAG: hypothetical protein OEQ47_09865 [Acidimicrobiia bacterium]|nr:hypothetical protein [Acidimicrobiia bacterium]